jgi:hypothetical protein
MAVTRNVVSVLMVSVLVMPIVGCGGLVVENSSAPDQPLANQPSVDQPVEPTRLSDGKYPIQQATYDDIDGTYTVILLNTAAGESSIFQTTNLPMARLTEEEIQAGEASYLQMQQGQPSLHLTEDFRIDYVHNVTEEQVNPQTGEPEIVVVQQERSFWTPFAGALAGQAIGNLLFTPQYYFPPVYRPGVVLTGYGSYGRTYDQAARQYQTRYNAPPTEVRNRQFRSTGRLRRSPTATQVSPRNPQRTQTNRPSGSGYGSTDLRRNNPSNVRRRQPGSGFGSSGVRRRSRRR